nr:reverse transcriptase domain-containing protein [Tanacetum cinerariifolium]
MTLTFAETHNMVAYLIKSDASEGFHQIIDFLNGSSIKYALTVNLNIYVSCIKQFWTTVAIKKVNDVIRLQALVDKKKVMCMSAKRTSWNEFSSSMASAVICLSSGRKFNFSKYIFNSLVRNVDSPLKFYMYPRFLQLIIRKQVGDLSTYTTKYTSPALTHKVFANIRRVGKGFSRVETPMFKGMLVAQEVGEGGADAEHDEGVPTAGVVTKGDVSVAHDEVPTADEEPSIPSPIPPTLPRSQDIPSTSQAQPTPPQSPQIAQALEITKLKRRFKKMERRNKVKVLKLRRLQKVGTTQRIESSNDNVMDDVSNQERMITDMDTNADVVLKEVKEVAADAKADQEETKEDETEPVEVQEVVDVVTTSKIITEVVTAASEIITAAIPKLIAAPRRRTKGVVIRDPKESTTTTSIIIHTEAKSKDKGKGILAQIEQDEKYARELKVELNRTIDWDEAIDHVIKNEKEDNNVVGFKMDYFKGMSCDDIRPIFERYFDSNVAFLQKTKEQIKEEESRALKRINETPTEKAAKRQKLDEDLEELKRQLQIVPNEDDDVYKEATPLARKVPVIDYEVINMYNKPYYKIIRADDTCQLYIITFTTTQLILLVERKYPLTRFTLDQMLNTVRLEVEEESKVSLELLRRSRVDPTLLNDFEMAAEGNADPPVPDLRTMEELCQLFLNGRGGPIVSIAIQATKFGIKNDMIQQSIKLNGVTDDALRLYLFSYSLTHHATDWFDCLPRNSINTFEQWATMFLGKYFPPSMVTKLRNEITNFRQRGTLMKRCPEECYDLIENIIAHHNDWDTSAQQSELSSSITSSSDTEIAALKDEMAKINKNLMRPPLAKPITYMLQEPIKEILTNLKNFQNQNRNQGNSHPQGNNQRRNQFFQGASHGQNPPPAYEALTYQASGYQASVHQPSIPQPQVVTTNEFTNFMKATDAILKNMQTNMTSLINSNLELKNMFGQFMKMNTASSSGSGTLPGNTITNPKEDLKGITTRSGTTYQGPMIPTTSSYLPLVVEREIEVTKDMVPPTNNRSTKDVQPLVVRVEKPMPNSEPVVSPIIEPVVAPVSALKPNQKPSIPYPSRFHDQKLCDKANDQKEKFFKIFQDLNFNISFADALILMPKFDPTIKTLLTNKDKLFELARTPLNEHCSVVLLKKLPEKLADPDKFLIPCDFLGMAECLVGENGCDVLACFTTFSNVLFEADYESDSSDYQSCSDEDFLKEIFSNPLFEEEIISINIDQHHFNAESDLIESMLNRDSSIISSSLKIDSLLDEFAGELTLFKSIPPGINETDCHPENEIRLIERLFYYLMEEMDLSCTLDDLMPPSIEDDDDDDSKRDILIHEELFDNYSLSLPVIESFYFDIPSFSRPPIKPLDGNTRILNIKMMGDDFPMPRLMITLASNQEKSPDLLSHQSLKIFKLSVKCPMMIHGKNIPTLDVPLFHFYPLDQLKYGENWVKLSDLKQALRGRHPMLINSLVFLFSS